MPAEVCVTLVQNKLKEFDTSIENIVSITTDGASVMKKALKLLRVYNQLCLAHGIQLGVIDVLYNQNNSDIIENENLDKKDSAENDGECSHDDDDVDSNGEVFEITLQEKSIDPYLQIVEEFGK